MFQITAEETYRDGQIIFKEGSLGGSVYMVQSGSVEVSKTIAGKKFLVDIMKPGDLFGELCFIYDMDRSVTARAVGETVIGVVDREFMDFEWNKLSSEFRTILIVVAHRLKKNHSEGLWVLQANRDSSSESLILKI